MCVAFVPALSNVINLVAAGAICFYLAVFAAYMSAMKVSKMETRNKNPVFPANQAPKQMNGNTQQYGYVPVQPVVMQQQAYHMAKY